MITSNSQNLNLPQSEIAKKSKAAKFNKIISAVKARVNIKNIISGLVLAYFIMLLIPTKPGNQPVVPDNKRIGTNEIVLFALVLLANSNIFERITQLKIGKDGVEFQVEKLRNNVTANRSASQKESAALTYLGLLIDNSQQQTEFFDILLDDGERETLKHLFEAERNKNELPYEKNEELERRLRHLRSLQFIASTAEELQISSLPEKGNLRQYFQVTDSGKLCLHLGSSEVYIEEKEINPRFRKMLLLAPKSEN